jgi:hypothetical protein
VNGLTIPEIAKRLAPNGFYVGADIRNLHFGDRCGSTALLAGPLPCHQLLAPAARLCLFVAWWFPAGGGVALGGCTVHTQIHILGAAAALQTCCGDMHVCQA